MTDNDGRADAQELYDKTAANMKRAKSIRERAESGDGVTVAEVAWLAEFTLRLTTASYEMLKAVQRWSDPTFTKRVELENALKGEGQ